MNIPGFTAEASLCKLRGHYQSVAIRDYSSVGQGVVSQMRAGSMVGAGGPFSGSCGDYYPGYHCCIFCYLESCFGGVGRAHVWVKCTSPGDEGPAVAHLDAYSGLNEVFGFLGWIPSMRRCRIRAPTKPRVVLKRLPFSLPGAGCGCQMQARGCGCYLPRPRRCNRRTPRCRTV